MVEDTRGKFDLGLDDDVPEHGWLPLRLKLEESVLIGNPMEGQYLKMKKVGITPKRESYLVSEMVDGIETVIGIRKLKYGRNYRLRKTPLKIVSTIVTHEVGNERTIFFNAPKNVDIVRASLINSVPKKS